MVKSLITYPRPFAYKVQQELKGPEMLQCQSQKFTLLVVKNTKVVSHDYHTSVIKSKQTTTSLSQLYMWVHVYKNLSTAWYPVSTRW